MKRVRSFCMAYVAAAALILGALALVMGVDTFAWRLP